MRNLKTRKEQPMRTDVYQKITDQIVSEIEQGVRPWMKPWNAEHAAGRITRPLRGNGIPYQGINVLMLWSAAMAKGYCAVEITGERRGNSELHDTDLCA
jgi:antirestriction protein ArdC